MSLRTKTVWVEGSCGPILKRPSADPARDDSAWITWGVFGARFWTERRHLPVPDRYRTVPHILNLTALIGPPVWPAVFGMALIIGAKPWYIDRMALLYDDLVRERPDLR